MGCLHSKYSMIDTFTKCWFDHCDVGSASQTMDQPYTCYSNSGAKSPVQREWCILKFRLLWCWSDPVDLQCGQKDLNWITPEEPIWHRTRKIRKCPSSSSVVNLLRHPPANTTRWPNAGLMLAHRLRRWANIKPALGQRVVFAGPS